MTTRHVRTIATSIGVFVTFALFAMWWRSYTTADRIEGWLLGGDAVIVTSKQGCLGVMKFPWRGPVDEWRWHIKSPPADGPISFPAHQIDGYTNRAGFGRLDYGNYIVSQPTQHSSGGAVINGEWIMGGQAYFLNGKGVLIPYWFLIMLGAFATLATRWRGRFTVRGMLIAMGVVAILLMVFKLWVFGDSDQAVVP
jgi:hypothetical protein